MSIVGEFLALRRVGGRFLSSEVHLRKRKPLKEGKKNWLT